MGAMSQQLEAWQQESQQKIQRGFQKSPKVNNLRLLLDTACSRTFPGLRIRWSIRDVGVLRSLLDTYSPAQMTQLIECAFSEEHRGEVFQHGVSAWHFSQACPRMMYELTRKRQRQMGTEKKQKRLASVPVQGVRPSGELVKKMPEFLRKELGL